MLKTPRLKTCVLAVTMAALPWFANAAGLGRLNVLSGLGQPFRGEIDLVSVQPGEADSLVVSLAPPEAFSTAQISYPPSALGLRFNIEKRGSGQYYVTVNSAQAITEPYLDLLLELNWASGRIQREYTALIDPVGYAPSVALGNATKFSPSVLPGTRTTGAIKSSAVKSTKSTTPQDTQTQEAAMPAEQRKEGGAKESSADSYTTKGGDTLSAVAKKIKPDGVSLDQVLVSLYRSNADAFDGNMNRLKRGKILRVQTALEMQQLSAKEAAKEVQVQSANWSEYRSKLGEAAAKAPARDLTEQASGGKITAKVQDQGASAVDKNKDVLKLSKAADAAKKSTDNSKVQALEEEVAARQKALNEANQRVAELQKNVADMEKLAAMRAKAATVASAAATSAAVAPVKASAVDVVASDVVASEVAVASEVVASAVVTSAPVAKVKKRIEVVAEVPEEPGFVEGLFENPLALGGGALAILLGAGGLWYARRRQRPGVFEDSIITGGDLKANTVLGSTGGGVISTQSTENSFLTDFSRQGLGTIDTDEVDPIAEAEVYMAYGRDAQAEEILKDALYKDPSRHEIRMKLLDIYAARKDRVSFEEHASALFAITGGKGAHWESAAENGRTIDLENPLYQDASAGLVDTSMVASAAVVAGGAQAVGSALADVTEPDLSQSLETDLDFELDLDPAHQSAKDSSSFELPEVSREVEELNFNEPELPLADLEGLSFDAVTMDALEGDATKVEVQDVSLSAALNDEMMALDLPIDLGFAESGVGAELADLDALAEFDLDAALNPAQEMGSDLSSNELSDFESMADSLDLNIATPVENTADALLEGLSDFELPELSTPDLAGSVAAQVNEVAAGLDDIGLDFDFDLNEEGMMNQAAPAGAAHAALDAPLNDISLDLDVAATGSELDFAADDPVQTKIDLARAYIDMGDVEGAREILQEAVQEGREEQQVTAKSLLADL